MRARRIMMGTRAIAVAATALLASCQHKNPVGAQEIPAPRVLPNKTLFEENRVPPAALALAMNYLRAHKDEFPNRHYLSVIDYSQPSSAKRFYLVDLRTQKVESMLVAHGKGSDPHHTGLSTIFSDVPRSQATSLGYFRTAETYDGSHGLSLKLIGLSSTNRNALARAIVIHGAPYVSDARTKLGRSWGCPAVAPDKVVPLVEKIKDGSLVFAWHPKYF